MHPAAYQFVAEHVPPGRDRFVVDFGSLDINGSVKPLFPADQYYGIDIVPGPNVHEVADAATWKSMLPVDIVVCCEVFEHTPKWREIVQNAYDNLYRKGLFICTAANPFRPPHSAIDGGQLRHGEHYQGIEGPELLEAASEAGFFPVTVNLKGTDVQMVATK